MRVSSRLLFGEARGKGAPNRATEEILGPAPQVHFLYL